MSVLAGVLLFSLVSSAAACDGCVKKTKAAFFSKSYSLSPGACGYGSSALGLSSGNLAAVHSSLFKDGAGCGACYKIRCKDPSVCSGEWTSITATDSHGSNDTSFVLGGRAFMSLASSGQTRAMLKLGVVDVEYERVPCVYNQNMALRVEESSQKPRNLVVKVLYQGGQTEIVGMDVASVGSSNWSYLSREFGAVWSTSRVPSGALQFRFVVTSGYDGKWVWAKSVLPDDWAPGCTYSTGLQLHDIALEACSPCVGLAVQ